MSETGAAAQEDDLPYWEKDDDLDPTPDLPVRSRARESAWSDHYQPHRPAGAEDDTAPASRLVALGALLLGASCFLTLLAIGAYLGTGWAPITDREAAAYTKASVIGVAIIIGSLVLRRTTAWDNANGMFGTTIVLSLISAGTFYGLAGLAN